MRGRPSKPIEAGQKYNMLTAVKINGQDKHGRFTWECLCDCGQTATVKATYLRTGEKKSCGCQQFAGLRRTHGHSAKQSLAYRIWKNMNQRCDNPKATSYPWYGAKGVQVCARWKKFENFLADMGQPPVDYTIERKNPAGDYTPSNCIWIHYSLQNSNKRPKENK